MKNNLEEIIKERLENRLQWRNYLGWSLTHRHLASNARRLFYKDKPLLENAITISTGIDQANTLFCSINIFLTAGSSNQAIPDVLAATINDNTNAIKIFFRCFLTYSL